jgi:hypothetical protein
MSRRNTRGNWSRDPPNHSVIPGELHLCFTMPSPLDQPELPTPIQTPQSDLVPTQPLATESSDTGAITAAEEARGAPDGQGEEVHTLDIGEGNIVKLDKLGPMIINSDGVSPMYSNA